MWYYVKDGTDRQGPVTESELRNLAESGQVLTTDLVWTDGQADWQPMNVLAEFGGQPAAAPVPVAAAPMAAAPVAAAGYGAVQPQIPPGLAGWMTFVGVMNIIGGAFMCLVGVITVLTIILPIIYIPFGVLLILSGTALTSGKVALLTATSFDDSIELFLIKIKRFMLIFGVFYIINVVLMVLGYIVLLIMVLGMGMSFTDLMQQGAPY
jgi:hypothetical protein